MGFISVLRVLFSLFTYFNTKPKPMNAMEIAKAAKTTAITITVTLLVVSSPELK